MDIDALVPWHPDFATRSPMYTPLQLWAQRFAVFDAWPGLADYQRVLDTLSQPILTTAGQPLRIVPQEGKPDCFEQRYESRINLFGEIQTRRNNWHDFFHLLAWLTFPRTKAVFNAIHTDMARARHEAGANPGQRSARESMLTLFDENGAVVISSDESLLQLIRDFQWKELFWQRRAELADKFQCITFGHALYEKALMPYLGMTANTILIKCDEAALKQPLPQRLQALDVQLAVFFEAGETLQRPRDLQPFPILGMPGWDENNRQETYYDNGDYFRSGRRERLARGAD
jgi:phage tail protein X